MLAVHGLSSSCLTSRDHHSADGAAAAQRLSRQQSQIPASSKRTSGFRNSDSVVQPRPIQIDTTIDRRFESIRRPLAHGVPDGPIEAFLHLADSSCSEFQ